MIKPNKNKLIPCADVAWGDIKGSISMQSDLMSLLSDYATESWVSEQGFMTSESLSGYATESWVEGQEYITSEALAGYATESWVSEQGFLSEVPSDYATKNWVNNKNFATKSWVSSNFLSEVPSQYATQSWVINKNYASKSWVSSNFLSEVPSEYATKSWVESNGYLSEIPSEYATKEWVSNKDYASKVWVYEQKYLKKVPSEYATQSWVQDQGYLTDAILDGYATESWVISTLSSYTPDMSSYATKSWVEDKGYITSSVLSGYATESWVNDTLSSYALSTDIPSLDGYATESWVQSQGYLTSIPSEYATQSWVSSNFLSEVPSSYATQSWVESQSYITSTALSGYATESWVESQGYASAGNQNLAPLFSRSEGYLKYEPGEVLLSGSTNVGLQTDINSNSVKNLCNTIGDHIYAYDPDSGNFYEFNKETFEFDFVIYAGKTGDGQIYPMWADSQGRMYYGNKYKFVDGGIYWSDMGGDFQEHTGTIKSNLIQKDGVTYIISKTNSCAYVFDEENQSFITLPTIPIYGTNPANNFYRYFSEFEGHWIHDAGSTQTELVFHLDAAEPYMEWVTLENRLFPGAWTYEYEGRTINETTRGVFIHPSVKNGVTEWYTFGYANPVMYKLVNGTWEIVDYNQTVSGMSTNAAGCACGTLWFGFAYLANTAGHIIIWNLDTNDYGIPEVYGWDASVDTRIASIESRLTALEQGYGDALSITNQILG